MATDLERLAEGFARFKQGTYWSSTGKCKGYAVTNPGEAASIQAYVDALVAGGSPIPPALATATGQGLVEMILAGFPDVVLPDPTPSPSRFPFRGLYCRDTEFTQAYPVPFHNMNLNVMECSGFAGSADTQITNRMTSLIAPDQGWTLFGSGFTPSASGGSFGMSDAKLVALMTTPGGSGYSVVNHPRNSHRYLIADEIDLTAYSGAELQANLATIKRRVDLVHSKDPLARVGATDYRQAQLDPAGPMGAIWKGILDEVYLDGYPQPNVDQAPYVIPNLARWCDAAAMPYVGVISCHDYLTNRPSYPTQAQFSTMMDQWAATKALALILYIYYDGEGVKHLRDDLVMQTHIGSRMLLVA